MRLRNLLIIPVLSLTMSVFAATNTTVTITKSTTLTGNDASEFQKVFGKSFAGRTGFNFICKDNSCTVISTKPGFSGAVADTLLKGRKVAKFSSSDENFQLNCGTTSVSFCNVIQKSAVLN